MNKCPFFSICGGCRYDFSASDYRDEKQKLLVGWKLTGKPFWTPVGLRRRADFCFADGSFGFFEPASKNIVSIKQCPNLLPEINDLLPALARLPWAGAGAALVTACDNGIDLAVNSDVPYFAQEFKDAVEKLDLIRVSWNGTIVLQREMPKIRFGDTVVDYPTGAFLQPTVASETAMRDFVVRNAAGAKKVVDLFCGIGNFTFALNATGFDIVGPFNRRDLFKKPLAAKSLNQYDCIVLDPPRAGALDQVKEIAKSNVPRVIYVSCNPVTLKRDAKILTGAGYKAVDIAAFDQFVGSEHWELAIVFER